MLFNKIKTIKFFERSGKKLNAAENMIRNQSLEESDDSGLLSKGGGDGCVVWNFLWHDVSMRAHMFPTLEMV